MTEHEPEGADRARTFDHEHYRVLMSLVQDGVVSRRQLEELGAAPHDIKRMVRRHELHRRLPGIFVEHNGPLTPRQQEWVAVLAHWP
ncbi:type IV toxin-antitoxin system AbiEi family antitoxin domain-containing protein [Nocardioides rubriscoriae]|uniref:type IV toxin-antitoxin system AbiEi family antitoxin domain-containing protein n=1 Tax=Nocardioides rubriscoriae TaxID=642762 RepID=UPI001B8660F5|nr:type IV toxin-antitoxin system AbiEi family antitoxin domain-containing protein [Nocardioides rubriscoriae]